MSRLAVCAVAPIAACLLYIFARDKYEKEPYYLLLATVIMGLVSTGVIWSVGNFLELAFPHREFSVFFNAFISSALVEEIVKFVFIFFTIWKNKNFNEPFDGMVYSVFVSMGFACAENIIYVFNKDFGGMRAALLRAVFSTPSHMLFGVIAGYYISLAKFNGERKKLIYAVLAPVAVHGIYNFILLAIKNIALLFLVPYLFVAWRITLAKMKLFIESSPFKN